MCMGVWSTCKSVLCVYAVPEAKEGDEFLGSRVTDDSEPPCGCSESNPGPLEE